MLSEAVQGPHVLYLWVVPRVVGMKVETATKRSLCARGPSHAPGCHRLGCRGPFLWCRYMWHQRNRIGEQPYPQQGCYAVTTLITQVSRWFLSFAVVLQWFRKVLRRFSRGVSRVRGGFATFRTVHPPARFTICTLVTAPWELWG